MVSERESQDTADALRSEGPNLRVYAAMQRFSTIRDRKQREDEDRVAASSRVFVALRTTKIVGFHENSTLHGQTRRHTRRTLRLRKNLYIQIHIVSYP